MTRSQWFSKVLILIAAAAIAGALARLQKRSLLDGEERGRAAIERLGCGSCHTIPGVHQANAHVGPPLDHFALRMYIGGVLPNKADNLFQWIKDPPAVDRQTAMPNLHLDDTDARDIVGYLYTLE